MDIGANRRISALLKSGDLAARNLAAECLGYYQEALDLAEQTNDVLRAGEVHLAIARAHLNVPAHRDPARYESHARQAISAGRSMGPFGASLAARGSLSLGNAIVEEQRQLPEADPERLEAAREALGFAATAEAAEATTRASARVGLGNLFTMADDHGAAAEEYLEACSEFEAAGDTRGLLMAQTNAALALARLGRLEDARGLAIEAVAGLAKDQAIAPRLLPTLQGVLAATERSK
jgi:hypothetical protein